MTARVGDAIKFWLPLLIWVSWIFFASSDVMSADHTSRYLIPFLRWLKPDIAPQTIVSIHFFIRKCAHLIEYAILAVLLWRAIHHQSAKWGSRFAFAAAMVLVIATICAAIDEFHQSFVASRTSSSHDVVIDGCGAFVGLTLCWWNQRHRLRSDRQSAVANRK